MKTRFYQIMAVSALCLAAAALAVALWTSVLAQEGSPEAALAIPTTLNYQGFLREPDGSLTTGSYDITAKIYNVATGGSQLYSTTITGVTVRDGLFNVVLGDKDALPSSVFASAPLYIGISLNGGSELIPRQRLHAVPWAFQASTLINNAPAQTVQGLTSNGNLTVNGSTTMNGSATVQGVTSNGNLTVNGDTAMNGSATVQGVTSNGNLTVNGDTAMNGSANISGNVVVTGTLAHPGETFVGPHFLDPRVPVKAWVEPCPATNWTDFNASPYIHEGATAVILEYVTRINVNWASIIIKTPAMTGAEPDHFYTLDWGRAQGLGDEVGAGGQGTFPIGVNGVFQYRIYGDGYNNGCRIDLIGYYY